CPSAPTCSSSRLRVCSGDAPSSTCPSAPPAVLAASLYAAVTLHPPRVFLSLPAVLAASVYAA
ncbi:hypothetical protein NDU88_006365, partial [Pleurodeles waltl]